MKSYRGVRQEIISDIIAATLVTADCTDCSLCSLCVLNCLLECDTFTLFNNKTNLLIFNDTANNLWLLYDVFLALWLYQMRFSTNSWTFLSEYIFYVIHVRVDRSAQKLRIFFKNSQLLLCKKIVQHRFDQIFNVQNVYFNPVYCGHYNNSYEAKCTDKSPTFQQYCWKLNNLYSLTRDMRHVFCSEPVCCVILEQTF